MLSQHITNAELFTVRGVDLDSLDRLAATLVRHLPSQIVFGFVGTLGAGKTRLTQAICREIRVDPDDVTSPTFTLMQSHQGMRLRRSELNATDSVAGVDCEQSHPLSIHHLDAYRLADEDEFLELGVDELFEQPDAWTIIEWADRVAQVMPRQTVWVEMQIEEDPTNRTITFYCRNASIADSLYEIRDVIAACGFTIQKPDQANAASRIRTASRSSEKA